MITLGAVVLELSLDLGLPLLVFSLEMWCSGLSVPHAEAVLRLLNDSFPSACLFSLLVATMGSSLLARMRFFVS